MKIRVVLLACVFAAMSRQYADAQTVRAEFVVAPASNLPGLPAAFIITLRNTGDVAQTLDGAVSLTVTGASGTFRAKTPGEHEWFNLPSEQIEKCEDTPCVKLSPHSERQVFINFGPALVENGFFWDRRLSNPGTYSFSLSLPAASDQEAAIATNTQSYRIEQPANADLDALQWLNSIVGERGWGVDRVPELLPGLSDEIRSRFPDSRYATWLALLPGKPGINTRIATLDAALAANPPDILRDNLLAVKAGFLDGMSQNAITHDRNIDRALLLAEQARTAYTLLARVATTNLLREFGMKGAANVITRSTAEKMLQVYSQYDGPAPKKIVPFVKCIQKQEKATFSALFGYDNPNSAAKPIDLGSGNQVTPAPRDQGQPRMFRPGHHDSAFEASSPGGELIWHLDGNRAVATADFPVQCTTPSLSK